MLREYREEHKGDGEPARQILEVLFDEIIAEDIHDPSDPGEGTDNMSAVMVEFRDASGNG